MFIVNVQNVSVHHLIYNNINLHTRIANSIVVVHVVNISNTNNVLSHISRDVVINLDLSVSRVRQIMKYVDSMCRLSLFGLILLTAVTPGDF